MNAQLSAEKILAEEEAKDSRKAVTKVMQQYCNITKDIIFLEAYLQKEILENPANTEAMQGAKVLANDLIKRLALIRESNGNLSF